MVLRGCGCWSIESLKSLRALGFSDPTSFIRSLPLAASKSKKDSAGVNSAMLGKEMDGGGEKDMCDSTVYLEKRST